MGQQGKVLYSRQKCLEVNSVFSTSYGLNNDVFKDLSLQTCYSSVVYLKCLKAFFVLILKHHEFRYCIELCILFFWPVSYGSNCYC